MPPRDNKATQPNQSISAWYGKVKPRVCTPHPTPQVLQQQVMYKLRKQKRAKVKAPTTVTQEDDKECHKILQRKDSYHTKVKALKYLEFTQDTIGHQKVMENLSAPRIKYQTTRMMQEAHSMHNHGCQSVLRDRHYNGILYKRMGKWLHHMEKTYQEWLHEVDLSYHILGLRHALIQKGLQRREEAPHNTACSPLQAKRTCTTRRLTGRTRASPVSPMHIPVAGGGGGAKKIRGITVFSYPPPPRGGTARKKISHPYV